MMIEKGKWLICFTEQWSQFFEKCNWYTFQLSHIEFENDKIMGGVELTFVFLGLGFRIRYNHTETEEVKYCRDAIKDIENGTAKTISLDDLKKELGL